MKKLTFLIVLSFLFSCVQKTVDRTVVYRLTIDTTAKINSIGLRGNDKPLNSQKDHVMNTIIADSLYETVITYKTGLLFTEVKFTMNGEKELKDQPSRRIDFAEGDTTYVHAVFNRPN